MILNLEHIYKDYQQDKLVVPVLKDVCLQVEEGEYVAIMGPSGSGKSTLAHCINGLVPFSYAGDITGTYRIKGEDPAKLGIFGLSKSVGTVLQDTDGQFIGLTVAEDIAFALENDRVEYHEMRGRVDKAADAVDVKALLDHAPGALSGGQKQRVAAARALITNPKLILADEPTGALDSKSSRYLLESMKEMNEGLAATILMVTHDAFTASYASRVIFIKDGKIFNEIRRGDDTRKQFFNRIIEVVTVLGGSLNDAL